jgi:hypothetical protein
VPRRAAEAMMTKAPFFTTLSKSDFNRHSIADKIPILIVLHKRKSDESDDANWERHQENWAEEGQGDCRDSKS